MSEGSSHKTIWLFFLVIILALAMRLCVALLWDRNFTTDEATFGLMTRHFLEGKFPVYYDTQRYMGSIESLVDVPFYKLIGHGIFSLRIAPLIILCAFLALHGRLVQRLWGTRVALYSLLVLALPGWTLLWFTSRSGQNQPTILLLETTALLLCLPLLDRGRFSFGRLIALGFIFGLGLWTHPIMYFCFIFIFILFGLQSPEWSEIHRKLSDFSRNKIGISANILLIPFFFGCTGLFILATFTRTWIPFAFFLRLARGADFVLMILISSIVLIFYLVCKRRKALIAGGVALVIGFLLGNLPQWLYWFSHRTAPSLSQYMSYPEALLFRFKLVSLEILPALAGIPALFSYDRMDTVWSRSLVEMVYWIAVWLFFGGIISYFIWRQRRVLAGFISLSPLRPGNGKMLLLLLMFLLPTMAGWVSGNTIDMMSVRHLTFAWQGFSIIMALFFSKLALKSKNAVIAAISIFVVLNSALNYRDYVRGQSWERGNFSTKTMNAVKDYLAANHVQGGYASSQYAYAFTYLFEEQLPIAPYGDYDTHQTYTPAADASHIQAYILFAPQTRLSESLAYSDFVQAMQREFTGDAKAPLVHGSVTNLHHLENRAFMSRRKIGNWDIWIVSDTLAAAPHYMTEP